MSTVYIHKPFPGVRKQPAVFLFLVLLHPQINMDFPVGIKPLCGFFPVPAPRAILHEHRRMCQAAPVLFVPYLPVPEQAPVLSVTVRKTPDRGQAHSAFLM